MTKKTATNKAVEMIPKIVDRNKDKPLYFEDIFSILVDIDKDFLDEFEEPRYGILRGIVSRYHKGDLFLKNTLIFKDDKGRLNFIYCNNEIFSKEKTYLLYINTLNYIKSIEENEIKASDYLELDDLNRKFIEKVLKFTEEITVITRDISDNLIKGED